VIAGDARVDPARPEAIEGIAALPGLIVRARELFVQLAGG
jgi:hypothetical protein